jgi:plasmid stabilization system protein ParE
VEKEIIWTAQAKGDLQNIYYFNTLALQDEAKAFKMVENILKKTEQLNGKISGGTRYISDLNQNVPYQKLIYKYYIIIYRVERHRVYINKIFDSRQNPKKLKL